MAKEIRLNLIGRKIEKPSIVRNQAVRCIQGRVILSDLNRGLSTQLFGDAPTLYLNPTEKMFLSGITVPGEPVATVLGSGDFAFESAFHGSKEILTFDINGNQQYMAALKLKGLQNFSYEDYWNFFCNVDNKDWMSPEIYKKLKKIADRDPNLYAFFDELMLQRTKEDRARQLFVSKFPFLKPMLSGLNDILVDQSLAATFPTYEQSAVFRTIAGMGGVKEKGTYLASESSYEYTREAIKSVNISFVKTDLIRLKMTLERVGYFKKVGDIKFQTIYLSNVPEFINGSVFARAVEEQLMPLLKSGGVIAYCCQGTSIDQLTMNTSTLNNLKEQLMVASPVYQNISAQQMVNSVEGLRLIRDMSSVDLSEVPTLCDDNGISNKDTYVYIKKK